MDRPKLGIASLPEVRRKHHAATAHDPASRAAGPSQSQQVLGPCSCATFLRGARTRGNTDARTRGYRRFLPAAFCFAGTFAFAFAFGAAAATLTGAGRAGFSATGRAEGRTRA